MYFQELSGFLSLLKNIIVEKEKVNNLVLFRKYHFQMHLYCQNDNMGVKVATSLTKKRLDNMRGYCSVLSLMHYFSISAAISLAFIKSMESMDHSLQILN